MKRFLTTIIAIATVFAANAQMGDLQQQHYYKHNVPAGNYSGMTRMWGNHYAVVNDKPETDGFDIFIIDVDSITGELTNVYKALTVSSTYGKQRDGEGIAYFPQKKTIFISGEADNRILEYDMHGRLTGRELLFPDSLNIPLSNYGMEALTYNAVTHRFWTTTESTLPQDGQQANAVNGVRNRLRLMAFDDSLRYVGAVNYIMEEPISNKTAQIYANGVTALCALDDGRLLVLEREAYVPKKRFGAWVVNRVYSINTKEDSAFPQKRLIAMWRTDFSLAHKDFANYEGMCLGPKLDDGRQVIILCADSQNQYAGLLRDWFRTIVLND